MTHLGERISDLVDGQLPPEAAERAHMHLAGCRRCRDAVESERLTKTRLAALAGPEPGGDLLTRLLGIGAPALAVPSAPAIQPVSATGPAGAAEPVTAVGQGAAVAPAAAPARSGPVRPDLGRPQGEAGGSRRPAGTGPGRRARRLRLPGGRVRVAASMLAAFGAMGAGAAMISPALPPGAGGVVPAVNTFVVQHAVTSPRLPILDVPPGWQITRVEHTRSQHDPSR